MTLDLLRRSSRAIAALLVLAALWGLPHRSAADDLCAPVETRQHDASKHVFTDRDGTGHGEHCAVCHWFRTLKPEPGLALDAAVPPSLGAGVAPVASYDPRQSPSGPLPARAPPAPLQ